VLFKNTHGSFFGTGLLRCSDHCALH